MRRPPRASESNISFSFEIVLLRQVSLAWSNRGGVRSGPCIQVFGVRQGSRRRGAEGHFHLSRRVGRDWPVKRVIQPEADFLVHRREFPEPPVYLLASR